eukprot:Pompholyxophrys_punicea_v1_NODE_1_length_14747_cov_12.267901.p11 type:complete len:130 gc:universal NODE_1_length_14747_cov_12.267901:9464-9075(-)
MTGVYSLTLTLQYPLSIALEITGDVRATVQNDGIGVIREEETIHKLGGDDEELGGGGYVPQDLEDSPLVELVHSLVDFIHKAEGCHRDLLEGQQEEGRCHRLLSAALPCAVKTSQLLALPEPDHDMQLP